MRRTWTATRTLSVTAAVVLAVGWIALTAAPGQGAARSRPRPPAAVTARAPAATGAAEQIRGYSVTLQLRSDGSMHVRETIEYDFGSARRHGITRTIPLESRYDQDHEREYPIAHITVTSATGAPIPQQVTGDSVVTIRIGDQQSTVTGRQTYRIGYDLRGVVTSYRDHQELYWNPIGTGWKVPISAAAVHVSGPASVQKVACFTGPAGSTRTCPGTIAANGEADFSSPSLAPGQAMTVLTRFPTGSFPGPTAILREHWRLGRAFSITPLTVGGGVALMLLLIGAVVTVVLRTGRSERYAGLTPGLQPAPGQRHTIRRVSRRHPGPVAVRFTPPDGMRPGQLGTLVHGRARPIDVTATIIDLAVRGFIRIDEVGRTDWRLVKLPRPDGLAGRLSPFESRLMDAAFRDRKDVLVSRLRRRFRRDLETIQGNPSSIQDRLETDVTERGWFRAPPSGTRRRWARYGILLTAGGAVLTAVLAVRSSYALLGTGVLIAGIVLLGLSSRMPGRTAQGTALLAQAEGFRLYLEKAEANQIRFEEGADVFSRYLPFAIVLGVADRWAQVFARLTAAGTMTAVPTSWYSAYSTDAVDYPTLTDSINGFSRTASDYRAGSTLSDPSLSGAAAHSSSAGGDSGGGYADGGGGGGGGGSW